MSPRIRFATPEDAALLHRFIRELADYEREPDAVEVTVAELRAQLSQERPPFECFIAEREVEGGVQPLGFALFYGSYSTWRGRPGIYLQDLYVAAAHRGKGVGRALLAALARLAQDRGCARLEWAVLDWNTPAIRFYEWLGALPLSEWTTYRLTNYGLEQLAARGTAVERAR